MPRKGTKLQIVFLCLFVALLAISVRLLTLHFMRVHLNDSAWFQVGTYEKFDRQASDLLDGHQRLFWIDDPARTDLAQYPPAGAALFALIYKLTGVRSAYAVQIVLWFADLILSFLLIVGIAHTAFGWRTAIASSFLLALSPLFAMYAAFPLPDLPATWFVLGGIWLLMLGFQRKNMWLALGAGLLLGVACWLRVNPLYLCFAWAVALFAFARAGRPQRLKMSAAVLAGTLIVISPLVIRNYLVFPDFTPTGGTIGANLWEGLGETEFGQANGFLFGDDKLTEYERRKYGWPADMKMDLMWPDGIRRDRARTSESVAFIRQHPVWYLGVMLGRMWIMLKVAGDPVPGYGSNGINVTSSKSLPQHWQGGVLAFGVNVLGIIQSVVRHLLLPLAAFGIYVAARKDWRLTGLLLATVLYYLVPGSAGHTEIRYVLPMHGILIVFAGAAIEHLLNLRKS